jgi:hypothetical protein
MGLYILSSSKWMIFLLVGPRERTTQKAIVVDALTAYFARTQENLAVLVAADKAFAEWDNEDDRVYDSL